MLLVTGSTSRIYPRIFGENDIYLELVQKHLWDNQRTYCPQPPPLSVSHELSYCMVMCSTECHAVVGHRQCNVINVELVLDSLYPYIFQVLCNTNLKEASNYFHLYQSIPVDYVSTFFVGTSVHIIFSLCVFANMLPTALSADSQVLLLPTLPREVLVATRVTSKMTVMMTSIVKQAARAARATSKPEYVRQHHFVGIVIRM